MTACAEPIIQGAFIFFVSYAMISDLRDLRVPNWVPLAIGGLFLLHSLLQGAVDLPVHLLTGAGVLVAGFALFVAGAFGGGDAKFLSVLALWMGPTQLGTFLLVTALLGGAAAVALVGLKKLLVVNPALENHAAMAKPLAWVRAGKMPYAVPIGLAALMLGPALF
jgi:prepilin peptidase CpaA